MSPLLTTFAGASDRAYGFGALNGPPAAFELISTQILSSTASTITFSSIPSTYKHLQIRSTYGSANGTYIMLRFNGDSATNYARHDLYGNGTSVASGASTSSNMIAISASVGTNFGAAITDILDYGNTSKNKTVKSLTGGIQSFTLVRLQSGVWLNTAAVTSIDLVTQNDAFAIGSRFSLYGVKGA